MIRIAGLALMVSLVAACGDEQQAFPIDPAGPPELPSGEFIADSLPEPFGAGDQLRVSFEEGQVGFSATCNQLSGVAEVDDDVLEVSGVGGTEMGCPGAGHEQDEWLVDFFTGSPTIQHENLGFTLSTTGTTLRFLVPDAVTDAVDLEETDWTLTGIEETDGDAVGLTGIPRGIRLEPALRIEGREITFSDGCNDAGGRVVVKDDVLRVDRLWSTLVACLGAASDVAAAVNEVLREGDVGWNISGTQLRLTRGDHALVYDAN